jgi:predicted ATP-dependent serine protease
MNFKTIGLSGDMGELVGDPEEPFPMMIFGGPGSGKSTLAIKLAFILASEFNKPIAYVAKEEGTGYTLKDKFKRMNAFHPNIDIYEEMPKDVSKYKYIFVDSANEMGYTYKDLDAMIKKYEPQGISFIFVFKGTKDGSYRGTQDIEHLVDVSIKCNNGIATTEKSRFGGRVKDEKTGFRIY